MVPVPREGPIPPPISRERPAQEHEHKPQKSGVTARGNTTGNNPPPKNNVKISCHDRNVSHVCWRATNRERSPTCFGCDWSSAYEEIWQEGGEEGRVRHRQGACVRGIMVARPPHHCHYTCAHLGPTPTLMPSPLMLCMNTLAPRSPAAHRSPATGGHWGGPTRDTDDLGLPLVTDSDA